ncbi:uncharacterized protein H6S33_009670 [Morchella sextelata]|uniref:uncharacterized protein n=1 Tax=Morchella sextelata TaxID=1174677 RepID=UPI001D05019F|nr:uncharacterized protein H6S33_009670 [Morchella sextelata]KAH0613290.1 hypothetical protein H6S33_009670 [Morchella sextelata]
MDKPTAIPPAPVREAQNVNIVSTSAIVRKVDQCLSKLYPEQREDPNPNPNYPEPASTPATVTASSTTTATTATAITSDFPAVSITSKAATASKAITVAEIVKRCIGEKGGQWYQYTALSSVTNDLPGSQKQEKQPQKKKRKTGDEDKAGEDEEDPYALLVEKTPPKKRKVPLLTIYISRSPIPELQKLHGPLCSSEQSGP